MWPFKMTIEKVGKLKDRGDVAGLINALRDSDVWVRSSAAGALGQLGDARAVEPLIKVLGDSSEWVRHSAAVALGKLGDKRAFEPLIKAWSDYSDELMRQGAAYALGQLGDARAVEPLIKALGDSSGWVRSSAAGALYSSVIFVQLNPSSERSAIQMRRCERRSPTPLDKSGAHARQQL